MTYRCEYKANGKVVLYVNGRKIRRTFKNGTEAERYVQSLNKYRRYDASTQI